MPLSGLRGAGDARGQRRAARGGDALGRRPEPARRGRARRVLWGGSPAIFDIRYETTPMGADRDDDARLRVRGGRQAPGPADPGLHRAVRREGPRRPGRARDRHGRGARRSLRHQQRLRARHARLRELPEPREARPRRRDLRHGGAPAAGHRAARRLPLARRSSRSCCKDQHLLIAAHTRRHREGADPLHVARHRARPARPLARGGRDAPSASGRAARWSGSSPPGRRHASPTRRSAPCGREWITRRARRGWGSCRWWRREGDRSLREAGGGARGPRGPRRPGPARGGRAGPAACGASSTRRWPTTSASSSRAPSSRSSRPRASPPSWLPLGIPGDDLVVGRVYPRAEALAFFVATVGEAVPARIRRLFDEGALAEGWMLDAVASAGADLLADRLAERLQRALRGAGEPRRARAALQSRLLRLADPRASGRSSTRCGRRRSGSRSTTRA